MRTTLAQGRKLLLFARPSLVQPSTPRSRSVSTDSWYSPETDAPFHGRATTLHGLARSLQLPAQRPLETQIYCSYGERTATDIAFSECLLQFLKRPHLQARACAFYLTYHRWTNAHDTLHVLLAIYRSTAA